MIGLARLPLVTVHVLWLLIVCKLWPMPIYSLMCAILTRASITYNVPLWCTMEQRRLWCCNPLCDYNHCPITYINFVLYVHTQLKDVSKLNLPQDEPYPVGRFYHAACCIGYGTIIKKPFTTYSVKSKLSFSNWHVVCHFACKYVNQWQG